jgi:hypothetical protein
MSVKKLSQTLSAPASIASNISGTGKGSLNWKGQLNESAPLVKERPTDWWNQHRSDPRGYARMTNGRRGNSGGENY